MKTRLTTMLLLILAACDGTANEGALPVPEGERIACAVDGASSFERVCTMERVSDAEGTTLTLRHPSGAFRRLLITQDGRGVVAADGADPATVAVMSENRIEVSIAGNRYQLPATVDASQ